MKTPKTEIKDIPIHQWTHDGNRVLLVKCINRDGTSHGGFIWPKSGPVKPEKWSRGDDCGSGGLFGWAWGVHCGIGRDPDACAEWIVFSALPENVILVDGDKSKAVPSEDEKTLPEVVYRGTQAGAMYYTLAGRLAWIQERSSGSASATGYRGSASATGDRGSASATGDRGSASATGDKGIALTILDYSTVEVCNGIAVSVADRLYWKVRKGAILCCRWTGPVAGAFPFALLVADDMKLKDGETVMVQFGKIVTQFTN
jgi:hypothetical protein